MGTLSSFASALIPDEISATSTCRFSCARLLGRAQKLKVIDNDQLHIVPVLKPSRPRAKLENSQPGRVVDKHLALGEFRRGLDQIRHIVLPDEAVADFLEIHPGMGAQETLHELLGAHFQAVDADRFSSLDRYMLGDIHCQSGLSHRRARGDDDHLARMHSVRHHVDSLEAGGQPGQRAPILEQLLNTIERFHREVLHLGNRDSEAIISDGQNLLLNLIEQQLDVALLFVCARTIFRARFDHGAQEVLFAKDFPIVGGVARRGNECEQVGDRGRAADLLEKVAVLQKLCQRNQVDRFAGLAHINQHREDPRVSWMMEVFLADLMLDALVQDPPRRKKDGTKKSLLRVKALGKGPVNIW